MSSIRILIVDDHEVVRVGLTTMLDKHPGFAVVGQAGGAAESVSMAMALKPDVVVMDVRMPDGSGVEACRDILAVLPSTKVIMLTSYADDSAALASVMAGASGYVLKQVGTRELIKAIETVSQGGTLLDPAVAGRVLEELRGMAAHRDRSEESLTEQERKILAFIGEGKTNREIGLALYLSEKTVRNYVSIILHKLNLNNRAQAAAYSARRKALGMES